MKNKHAQNLVKLRLKKMSKEQIAEHTKLMVSKRQIWWDNLTEEQRKEHIKKMVKGRLKKCKKNKYK